MSTNPPKWTKDELLEEINISANNFREERLRSAYSWEKHYLTAKEKFEVLFNHFGDLNPENFSKEKLASAYKLHLGEALRYLAGPPISDDDLKVLAEVESLTPNVLAKNEDKLRRVFNVIDRVIDPFRFPWVIEDRPPNVGEREAAILASSVLLAAQRIAAERRNEGKNDQESRVKDYLVSIGFREAPPETITTIVKGPQNGEFCAECLLGERKADVVIRLWDTRLMAIECKVSNSATNSVQRINNDAAVKAAYWLKTFGSSQIVPAAMLSGVFKALNLEQAQNQGLNLLWAHDLNQLGHFIKSTS